MRFLQLKNRKNFIENPDEEKGTARIKSAPSSIPKP